MIPSASRFIRSRRPASGGDTWTNGIRSFPIMHVKGAFDYMNLSGNAVLITGGGPGIGRGPAGALLYQEGNQVILSSRS